MHPTIRVLIVLLVLTSCGGDQPQLESTQAEGPARAPRAIAELAQDDGQWVMPAKDYASTRFSGLTEITADNVAGLELAWSFSTGVLRGREAAPLVIDNTLYVTTPHPNYLYALDAVTGEQKWRYDPGTDRAAAGVACCDVVNRGAAYHDGRIYYNTLDNHTVAVDAETGAEV